MIKFILGVVVGFIGAMAVAEYQGLNNITIGR